jgi:hypothetical protein
MEETVHRRTKGAPNCDVKSLVLALVLMPQLIFALPVWAEATQNMWGVWKGTLDDADIMLCIQADPDRSLYDAFAAIYTTANYRIELLDRRGDLAKTWSARADENRKASLHTFDDGSIRMDRSSGDAWSGVTLAPIPFSQVGDNTRPCESAAFNQPRAILPTLQSTNEAVDRTTYEVLTLINPAGNGEVSTFQLKSGPEADEVINRWLRRTLHEKATEAPYYTCTIEALGAGTGSLWEHRLRPEMISDHFVVVTEVTNIFCGGPYPIETTQWYVLDRKTGEEIDTSTWLHPDAFNLLGPSAGDGPEIGNPDIEIGFKDLLTKAFLATHPDEGCLELLDYVRVWNIRPSKAGFILTPEIPNFLKGCAEDLTFATRDIEGYLSEHVREYLK